MMSERLIDNGILYIIGIFLMLGIPGWTGPVVVVLLALLYVALSDWLQKEFPQYLVMLIFLGAGVAVHPLLFFLPLLVYDCFRMRTWQAGGITGAGIIMQIFWYVEGQLTSYQLALWGFGMILAGLLAIRTQRAVRQTQEVIRLKDSSTELRLVMQKRQQDLMEKQDYEIHLATLQERNRIAREIHDNVGHMLSRSILQIGALQTIHKEEPLHGQLVAVNDTLSQAMNNIRESVHDLHNESMDLHQAILEIMDEFREQYQIAVTYDMSSSVPRNVKYCFLAILKEAMANIVRHSNATHVTLYLCEHPGFYQMLVEDNGTQIQIHEPVKGIGLANMHDRVEALGGTIAFLTDRGFVIRISIPKYTNAEGGA